jgi:small redox-active disulfide protein 2
MSERKGFFKSLFAGKKSGGCCDFEIVEESEESRGCCCAGEHGDAGEENKPANADAMSIKILGAGCKKCNTLLENTKRALVQMDLQAKVEKVTDLSTITGYGVMSIPALVINEKVVSSGKVLKPGEIVKILEKVR